MSDLLLADRLEAAKRYFPDGKHPECLTGEVWVGNVVEDHGRVGWQTGRIGKVAYVEGGGKVAEHLMPLFAQDHEVKAAPNRTRLDGCVHVQISAYAPHWADVNSLAPKFLARKVEVSVGENYSAMMLCDATVEAA